MQLAETRWGVIPIQYRPVPCNYQPQREANKLNNPTPGWQPSWGESQALTHASAVSITQAMTACLHVTNSN